jgi:hypothetical protein
MKESSPFKKFVKVAAISTLGVAGAHSLDVFKNDTEPKEVTDPKKIELEKKHFHLLELQRKQNSYDLKKGKDPQPLETKEREKNFGNYL